MTNEHIITVTVKYNINISFWNALKLRLASGEVIKEFIDEQLKEITKLETKWKRR